MTFRCKLWLFICFIYKLYRTYVLLTVILQTHFFKVLPYFQLICFHVIFFATEIFWRLPQLKSTNILLKSLNCLEIIFFPKIAPLRNPLPLPCLIRLDPPLAARQHLNVRLHPDRHDGRIVVPGQVVRVVVVVDGTVLARVGPELGRVLLEREHLALVRNGLHVVFVLVRRLEQGTLKRRKTQSKIRFRKPNISSNLPGTWDWGSPRPPPGGRTTWPGRPCCWWTFPTSTRCGRCRAGRAGPSTEIRRCRRPRRKTKALKKNLWFLTLDFFLNVL